MWIFTSNAFVSIVQHRNDPTILIVRARYREDLREFLGACKIVHLKDADYPYRAEVDRLVVTKSLAVAVENLHYDNFKNSVRNQGRHWALLDVWAIMRRWQDGFYRPWKRLPKDKTEDIGTDGFNWEEFLKG